MITSVVVLVNLTPVQNFLAKKAAATLASKLKTRVTVEHVRIDFLNHLLIQGLYLEDRAGDTLLYAGEARVRITDWFILRKDEPVIHYIGLKHAYGHLYRTRNSEVWNYQFIIDAFDTGKKDTSKKQNEFELDLEKLELHQVRFHQDDAWAGSDNDIDISTAVIDARKIDIKKKQIDINSILLRGSTIAIRDYEGGRPPRPRKAKTVDTTAFNPGRWMVRIKDLRLEDNRFSLDAAERAPYPGEFDPSHIGVDNINVFASGITIEGDTIRGKMDHFSAVERSGLILKKLSANVIVSPNATICDNLYLETNRSKLQHYYAMHYTRFPDFEDYVDKVRMVASISGSYVDSRDIAFFAPVLRQYPTLVRLSGNVAGTVDSLSGKKLYITDGSTSIKGNLAMTGLPDIYNTFIRFEQGEVLTTSSSIFRYAPALRRDPNVAWDKLSFVHFRGNYIGYIENFAANGVLNTNLGSIHSDMKLRIPDFNTRMAVYHGTVATEGFQLGSLLRQPMLGSIGFRAGISGAAFDPRTATLRLNAILSHIDVKGYRYRNISAEGTLERKKFSGNLLVDDPNLAMAFNGNIDFSQAEMNINATANVLKSDLRTLNLINDSIAVAADFDLNFIGSNIDDFRGYAKLYNINLTRDQKRIDIDSLYASSSYDNGEKVLVLESNDITARLRGNFQLSSLPYSFQFYIAGYLPNYIQAPTRYAPNQDFSFHITTRTVDSLWPVIAPAIRGFNNSDVQGSLNTASQQLTLQAAVPSGSIDNIALTDVAVKGTGNFTRLTLDADVGNIMVGKNILNASMEIKGAVGNDSMNFDIATRSPDAVGTANIRGSAFASGDTLYMNLLPSDFYLNQNQWEIPSGNYFVFSKNYLKIGDLTLRSGGQKIDVYSENELTDQTLHVNLKDLDVAALGNMAGLSSYNPAGKINGQVRLDHIFNGLKVASNLKATDVQLGRDTLGTINVIGLYDASRKIITLDPQSGVYRDGASIRTAGSMSFDSSNRQQLNGYIQFNEAEVAWATPFVADLVSDLSGKLNGTVNIGGSAVRPDMTGTLTLSDVSATIDAIGTTYRIPTANIAVSENRIALGNIRVYDVFNNVATLGGEIRHDRFADFSLSLNATASEFQALNLKDYGNASFYGDLIAHIEQLTITGPINDIRMRIVASPADKSHIYIPIKSSTDVSSYSYVSFKSYGKEEEIRKRKRNKFSLDITGKMNPLLEMTLVLDPATGDEINASGYGTINMEVPADGDVRVTGKYEIDQGNYVFTLRQLFFRRNFTISSGSTIDFRGDLSNMEMNIKGLYSIKARLYDLLDANEKNAMTTSSNDEKEEAKRSQIVNVLLDMSGSLNDPKLGFKIDLAEKRSETNYAYQKLKRINQSDRELFDQVAALLLVNTFIPPEGWAGSTALTGSINNISEILSSTASTQLTNILNKLLGDPDLQIDLKYKNYNLSDPNLSSGGINRNEISFGLRKNLLKDRLVVEVGNYYDWGRPTSSNSSTSNLNLAGDFRVQYLLTEDGRVRLNAFRTNNYDVLLDRSIWRGGLGVSYRRSFNNLYEFFHRPKDTLRLQQEPERRASDSVRATTANLR